MKLNVKALALAGGLVWGVAVLFITYWFLVFGYEGETLAKLTNIYWGYSVTWYGGFVGLFWGFIDGAVGGAALAWVYNKIVDRGAASS